MTRTQYKKARRMVRDNGLYALRWLDAQAATIMEKIYRAPTDWLAERADIVAYCKREGLACNVRHTGRM